MPAVGALGLRAGACSSWIVARGAFGGVACPLKGARLQRPRLLCVKGLAG